MTELEKKLLLLVARDEWEGRDETEFQAALEFLGCAVGELNAAARALREEGLLEIFPRRGCDPFPGGSMEATRPGLKVAERLKNP